MRRVLTILTAIVVLLASSGVGVITADLPFWRRAFDLPLAPGEAYLPIVEVGLHKDGARDAMASGLNSVDPAVLETVTNRARTAGVDALLVLHHGHIQLEHYFVDARRNLRLLPADFVARLFAALSVGFALADGHIQSLDEPVSKFLPEWVDDPRGKITLRQLLQETSGLSSGVDANAMFASHPFADWSRLPKFATSRGVRLLIGNDFESTALNFELVHEPGGFFNVSPVNTQLAAVIVERATGISYEDYLDERLLRPYWFFTTQMSLDRRSGMPAAHCCLRTNARDVLKLAELLREDGVLHSDGADQRVFPAGWVAEMHKGSRANPEFGLQLERSMHGAREVWQVGSGFGGALWIVPTEELTVVVLADRGVKTPIEVLDQLIEAVRK
jgi:Beta-lactamase